MHRLILIFVGIGVIASVAVGILAISYNPYQASLLIKSLFFGGLGIAGVSLIGILYCLVRILINRFSKKHSA